MIGQQFVIPQLTSLNEIIIDYYLVKESLGGLKYLVQDQKRMVYQRRDDDWELSVTYQNAKETYQGNYLGLGQMEIPWYLDRRKKISLLSVDVIFKEHYPGDAGPPISTEEVVFKDYADFFEGLQSA